MNLAKRLYRSLDNEKVTKDTIDVLKKRIEYLDELAIQLLEEHINEESYARNRLLLIEYDSTLNEIVNSQKKLRIYENILNNK